MVKTGREIGALFVSGMVCFGCAAFCRSLRASMRMFLVQEVTLILKAQMQECLCYVRRKASQIDTRTAKSIELEMGR